MRVEKCYFKFQRENFVVFFNFSSCVFRLYKTSSNFNYQQNVDLQTVFKINLLESFINQSLKKFQKDRSRDI